MRVKVGNQKAARYMIGDGECEKCVFYFHGGRTPQRPGLYAG